MLPFSQQPKKRHIQRKSHGFSRQRQNVFRNRLPPTRRRRRLMCWASAPAEWGVVTESVLTRAAEKNLPEDGLFIRRSPNSTYNGLSFLCSAGDQSTSMISPANKSEITSSTARKYQSRFAPPVSESSSPASFNTLIFVFRDTAGLPTPARKLAMRNA
jgi:hypothetical protein